MYSQIGTSNQSHEQICVQSIWGPLTENSSVSNCLVWTCLFKSYLAGAQVKYAIDTSVQITLPIIEVGEMRTTFFFRERVSVMECLHLDKVPFQLNPVWSYYLNMTMFVFLITLSPLPFIPQPFPCLQLHFCTSRPVAEVKPRVSLPSLTTVSLSAPSARTPPLSGSVSPAEH